MTNPKFTVMDVETTGLFSGGTDRIIEIALISLDSEGNIIGEYETLLNPERDLGPIHIHQITGTMVQNAPFFSDIVGDLAEVLAGTIVVGHNVSFDYRFLESEFQRAGVILPTIPSICTLKLVKEVNPHLPSGKLINVCQHYQIPLENSHSAYADCLATAKLFKILQEEVGLHNLTQSLATPLGIEAWPNHPKSNVCFTRAQYQSLPKENYIADLIRSMPPQGVTTPEGEIEYLTLLDHILANRRITSADYRLLQGLALEYQISQGKAVELHQRYLVDLIRIALLDELISDFELADLQQVADLLSISESDLDTLLAEVSSAEEIQPLSLSSRDDLQGKTVCFTGTLRSSYNEMKITRSLAQQLALEHGLIVKHGVTKNLDFLVVADPDSMSGKARKARAYNIQIMAEQAFWSMLRIPVS